MRAILLKAVPLLVTALSVISCVGSRRGGNRTPATLTPTDTKKPPDPENPSTVITTNYQNAYKVWHHMVDAARGLHQMRARTSDGKVETMTEDEANSFREALLYSANESRTLPRDLSERFGKVSPKALERLIGYVKTNRLFGGLDHGYLFEIGCSSLQASYHPERFPPEVCDRFLKSASVTFRFEADRSALELNGLDLIPASFETRQ